MKVLVTGAAGRVGANMVTRLVAEGVEVVAMVAPGDPQAQKLAGLDRVRIVEADLGDQAAVDVACQDVTHVIHLAAQLVRGETPVDRFYDVNAFGTLRLLEGVVRHSPRLERFVLVSTDGTYRPGNPPAVPLDEHVEQEPAEYYGTSKLLGEVILRNHAAQYDIPFSIVRFATVVSPEEASAIFTLRYWRSLLSRARLGKDTNIWQLFTGQPDLLTILDAAAGDVPEDTSTGLLGPDGTPWSLHMADVRDAVQGVYRALTEPAGGNGEAFNIAAAAPTRHDEGAAIRAEILGGPTLMVSMPLTWRLEVTVDAARERLGYVPRHDYRSMIEAARDSRPAAGDSFIPARI
jgi:nucleoside-diphosphate-sugar epimerase